MSIVEACFIVSIDVECDKDPDWQTADPVTFHGVTHAIVERLQPLFVRWGIRPTYLLSPEVIADPACCVILRGLRDVELGTHLHGDYIVPQIESWHFGGTTTREMQHEYPPALEREKLATLTELFRQQLGVRPTSFRAGRFGVGRDTGKWLIELGYGVDSSVTPHIAWTDRRGRRKPDFRGVDERPYPVASDGDLWTPGDSTLLEVPVTILGPGTLEGPESGTGPAWFRPWYSSLERLRAVMRQVLSEPPVGGIKRPLVMMFHNVELVPKASPYPQTQAEVESYLGVLEHVFAYACELGIASRTLSEFREEYLSAKDPCAPREAHPRRALERRDKGLDLPDDVVDAVLERHGVQPWFGYIFRERASRWDVWQPCFWIADNVPQGRPILSVGCGVGFNLMWLAVLGFSDLHGLDLDGRAVAAGEELAARFGWPLRLWVDDGLHPLRLPYRTFSVIEALNWTMLCPGFSIDEFLDTYLPYLGDGGVLILDAIDASYSSIPNSQYMSADWERPESERRATEYKVRLDEAAVRAAAALRGLEVVRVFSEPQAIPKRVYILRRLPRPAPCARAERAPGCAQTLAMGDQTRPRVIIVADVPDSALDGRARMLASLAGDEFDIQVGYAHDAPGEAPCDLVYALEWNLVDPARIEDPSKYVAGIGHRPAMGADELARFGQYLEACFQRVHAGCGKLERLLSPHVANIASVAEGVDLDLFSSRIPPSSSPGAVRLGAVPDATDTTELQRFVLPLGQLRGVELVAADSPSPRPSSRGLREWLESVDVFVAASADERSGTWLLAAAAMGRVLITTDTGIVSELLVQGESALIVGRDLARFIDAVVAVRDDPALRVRLADGARRAVAGAWGWDPRVGAYREFLRRAVHHRRNALACGEHRARPSPAITAPLLPHVSPLLRPVAPPCPLLAMAARIAHEAIDEIVIYGAGGAGRELLGHLRTRQIAVRRFVDASAALWNRTLAGIPVVSLPTAIDDGCHVYAVSSTRYAAEMRAAIDDAYRERDVAPRVFAPG